VSRRRVRAGSVRGSRAWVVWLPLAVVLILAAGAAGAKPPAVPRAPALPRVPPPPAIGGPVGEATGMGPGPDLPDLVPLPAFAIYVATDAFAYYSDQVTATVNGTDLSAGARRALRFATRIANRGPHSLDIVGVPRRTGDRRDPVGIDALQCVRLAGPRVRGGERACLAYEPVGSLSYHATHGHFHLDGFAQYLLLRDRGGRPDTTPPGIVARSEKVGFCMADTDQPGADEDPVVETGGWYQECRYTAPSIPGTLRQGISPGWADTYGPGLEGQHLRIDHVPDGLYWIAITINPPQWRTIISVRETNLANNTSYRRIRLHDKGTKVQVL